MEQDINKIINDLEMALLTDLYGHITTLVKKEDLEHLIKAYKEKEQIEEEHKKINGELREKVKQLEEENIQLEACKDEAIRRYNFESIPVSLVEEKIEELKKLITEAQKELGSASKEYTIYVYQKDVLQELLEKRK